MSFPKYPKYRDSGVEWLGEVPEHWHIKGMRNIANIVRGASPRPAGDPRYFGGESVPWVTVADITKDDYVELRETRVLKAGAVIASCVGTFGIAAINSSAVIINQQLQAFIPSMRINVNFLRHCVVNSAGYFEQIGTAATIVYVNQLGFENMPLAVPPLGEQAEIVDSIARRAAKLDALTTEAECAIELLQERRTALISAAVTGKIDVRYFFESETT